MKKYHLLNLLVVVVSIVFMVSALVFNYQGQQQLKAVRETVSAEKLKLAPPTRLTKQEKLVNQQDYQTRTNQFLQQATKLATSDENQIKTYSATNAAYGTLSAFQTIKGDFKFR